MPTIVFNRPDGVRRNGRSGVLLSVSSFLSIDTTCTFTLVGYKDGAKLREALPYSFSASVPGATVSGGSVTSHSCTFPVHYLPGFTGKEPDSFFATVAVGGIRADETSGS